MAELPHRRSGHECPIDGCTRRVPSHQLLCAPHWRAVPRDLQRALYRTWDNGRGAGTDAHNEAMHAVIHAAEAARHG
jgi:hypothetical protein